MASNVSLYMDQGITFGSRVVIHYRNDTPVDLTDCDVAVTFRRSLTSPTAYTFDVVKEDAQNGVILLTMTAENTATIQAGRYVFDGEYTLPTGEKYSFVQGILTVYPRVTR